MIGEAVHRQARNARKGTCGNLSCRFFREETTVVEFHESTWMMIPDENCIYARPLGHSNQTLCEDCLLKEVKSIFGRQFEESVAELEESQ